MKCSKCGHDNRAGAKFCEDCGVRLALICSNCGSELSSSAKFCAECGHAVHSAVAPPSPSALRFGTPETYTPKPLVEKILLSKSALEGERKQVTALFADLKGSMELFVDRDPEDVRRLLDPVIEHMMEAVHQYEGTVNHVLGDGIVALFGAPVAHEDHAVRACYAALRMQDSIRQYAATAPCGNGTPIQIRIGLNSGEVVVRSIGNDLRMDYSVVGQTANVAARMEQMAAPGSILIAAETLMLAEGYIQAKPLGPLQVKGLQAPVEVYELTGARAVRSRLHAAAARGLTRFVGREADIDQLQLALERARTGHGQIVAVVGEPGVGKSRLYWEFIRSEHPKCCLILESRSVSYGRATAFLPIINLLRDYCQIEVGDDARKIQEKLTGKLLSLDRALEPSLPALLWLLEVPVEDAQWLRLDPPQRRQRALESVKRLLLRESQLQPLVIVFEDLHWIDGETQSLLESLVESLPTARLLLLVNYRPEYHHTWGSKSYYRQISIAPLPPDRAEQMLDALLGEDVALQPLKRLLIVATIERLYPERLSEHIEKLAHHAFRGEDWERAAPYLRQAGAKAFARSVNREAASYFEQAMTAVGHLPQSRDTLEQAVDVRLALRNALWPLGRFEDGFGHLRDAEPMARELGDQRRLGWIAAYMSEHTRQTGHAEDAPAFAERALRIADKLGDLSLRVAANYYLGTACFVAGKYLETDDYFQTILDLLAGDRFRERCGLAGFPAVMSRMFWPLALAERGEFARGLAEAQEGVRLAEELDHPYSLICAMRAVGRVHGGRGDFEKAIPIAEKSLALSRERYLPQLSPELADLRGHLYVLYGRFADGVSLLEESLAALESMGMFQWRSSVLVHLGEAYLEAGRTEDALATATRALTLASERGHRGYQAWALRLLGEIAARRHGQSPEVAEAHYGAALALASELHMRPLVAHCHAGLGRLSRSSTEQDKVPTHLTAAATMYREMGMQYWAREAEARVRILH